MDLSGDCDAALADLTWQEENSWLQCSQGSCPTGRAAAWSTWGVCQASMLRLALATSAIGVCIIHGAAMLMRPPATH